MAPRLTARRQTQSQSEHVYALGERGRKTGVTLRDTGVRDEHGMEPIDDIFSSPEKAGANGTDEDESSDEGEDMDIDPTAQVPDPASLLNRRDSIRIPPRARSPVKTNLQSPALKNRLIAEASSPTRGSVMTPKEPNLSKSVKRKLDFSMDESRSLPKPNSQIPKTNGVNKSHTTNGRAATTPSDDDEEDEEDEEAILHGQDNELSAAAGDDSVQMIEGGGYDDPPSEPEEPVQTSPKRRRADKDAAADDDSDDKPVQRSGKRQRTEGKPRGRPKASQASAPAKAAKAAPKISKAIQKTDTAETAKPKRGRKRRSSDAAEAGDTSVVVPRGPPLPKSRGLVITRREAPGDFGFTTRSGRNSFKPLAFWRNEHVEFNDEGAEAQDMFAPKKSKHNRFLLPTIKEIHRVDETEEQKTKRTTRRPTASSKGKKQAAAHDDSDDEGPTDPWEEDPGTIDGEVVVWQPEHELYPPGPDDEVEFAEDQIALAASAIQTAQIRDATFRFAKTLSLPFFGSGIVDLPPGSEKRAKNSRKMHMTFFVHYGRALITVNETSFRISKGGMWFVPRGNYYSIENDYDKPARIFFAQGCEVQAAPSGEEE